jgi:hypothetical protein
LHNYFLHMQPVFGATNSKSSKIQTINQMGIFTIKVPLFRHRFQRLCFCYLPNTKSKWNKFKWEILNNSNYDNFRDGGGFSHLYVIICINILLKNQKCKKWIHKFIYKILTCFLAWKFPRHFSSTWGHKF